ncbi:Membrane protein involved in the export of O-antigen and teichoic acid [Streptomyces indicus]|uniref:Membrane protein involved in the export of O-antigen and teichoic acid n=2 Tax=Streptomyces indicus TaxID=417292 RepID=A0A1G8TQ93_9ACTN|nr:Membrane protein involved in the export of O-antigen and teichoic acid [Streptomyces indicus]
MTTEEEQAVPAARARHARPTAWRAVAGRLSWGLADQAASSLTNFAVGIYVARSLGLTAFGVFSLAWVTYGVVLSVSRGIATDPLVVRFSGVPEPSWREASARATGTALGTGLALGALSLGVGLAAGGRLGFAFAGLGLVLPGLLLQDAWRFTFFAAGDGRKAFVNDLAWGIALVPALVLAARVGSVTAFVLAWGGSAGAAAAYGCLQSRIRPRVTGLRTWLREHRDLGYRYLVENVGVSGAAQLRAYGLGAIVGVGAVGVVRGAELLLGPFLAVVMGLSLVTVAEAARVLRQAPGRLGTFCLWLSLGQAVAALLWGAALLFVPDGLGELVLGDVWPAASELIVPAALGVAGVGLGIGAASGLRALAAARRSLRCQLFASACYVGGGLGGAALGGTVGSAWGVAAATVCGSAVWWWQMRSALREYHPPPISKVRTP